MAGLVTLMLAGYGWRRRSCPGAPSFALAMVAASVYSLAVAMDYASSSLAAKIFWEQLAYVGGATVPVAWLVFAAQYSGLDYLISRRRLVLLLIVPAVSVLVAFTNSAHGLLWREIRTVDYGELHTWTVSHGAWYPVHLAYSHLALATGLLAIGHAIVVRQGVHRAQAALVWVAVAIPMAGDLAYSLGVSPLPSENPAPFLFAISGAAVAWSALRYRLLDLIPIARDVVVEALSDAIVVLDERGRIADANSAGQRLAGLPLRDLIGRTVSTISPVLASLIEHLGDNQHMQVEFPVASDDALHCFDLRVSSFTAPGGARAGAVLLLCDITAQRRAEEALEEQRISYEDLVDSVREAVLVQDANGVLITASRGAEEVFGVSRDQLLGRSLSDLIPQNPDGGVALADRLHWALEGEPQRFEARGLRSGGESFPAAVRLYRTSQRGEAAVVALIADTSEHQRAEESQRLAVAGQLAAGVAHEFNNLLAALLMRAELAARSSHEETRQLAAVVKRSAQRGAEVCGNLLAFARPRPPQRTALRVETPLESALQVARHQLMASGAQVVRDYQTGAQQVLADDGQLEQVFLNLILNACHALASSAVPRERRQLLVSTRLDQGPDGSNEVIVSLTDTGVGMDPQSLSRAFEPFFTTRASTDNKSTPKGSGLGLSVSHGIIAAHDGRIELQSQLGEGTTTELHLPAVVSSAGATSGPAEQEAAALFTCATGVGRVLVAEDEEEVRSLISEVITLSGCQTMAVATTGEAISALGQHRFSVVVSDLMMPGGGGEEILRYSQTLDCPPPVIIVTGKIEAGLANQVMSLGARRLLSKPFSLQELRSAVLELVGN